MTTNTEVLKAINALNARIDGIESKKSSRDDDNDDFQPLWRQKTKNGRKYIGGKVKLPDGSFAWVSVWENQFATKKNGRPPLKITVHEFVEKEKDSK